MKQGFLKYYILGPHVGNPLQLSAKETKLIIMLFSHMKYG